MKISIDWLEQSLQSLFEASGVPGPEAAIVARSLTAADARGVSSHGSMLLPMYLERLDKGSVKPTGKVTVVADRPAAATLDADRMLGQVTGHQAMALAAEKADLAGIGAVTVRNAFHFGGAFEFVRSATKQGLIGIAAANTRPLMAAPGGAHPVVGNNPLAIGLPRSNHQPVILDMALSEAALGRIRLAEQEGREIPPTWSTDEQGLPTTDPSQAIRGMLLPIGGPKGFGLALMVDVLTGVLSGGGFGDGVAGLYEDMSRPNNCAHFFAAIDPGAFVDPDDFATSVEQLVAQVHACPPAPGVDRVYLPGEIEAEREAAARAHGVELPDSVMDGIHVWAAKLNAELPAAH